MDLFRTFCLLWSASSDWWAKLNECRDSDGKRLRSSLKAKIGEAGPEGREPEGRREGGSERFREEDLVPGTAFGEGGCREGTCRMRRRPVSRSGMTGDLGSGQQDGWLRRGVTHANSRNICGCYTCPVELLQEGMVVGATHLASWAKSAGGPEAAASNEALAFLASCAWSSSDEDLDSRLPVLLFRGMDRWAGADSTAERCGAKGAVVVLLLSVPARALVSR